MLFTEYVPFIFVLKIEKEIIMRVVVFKEKFSGTQLDKVFTDLKIPFQSIVLTEKMSEIDLDNTDLLVMSMDVCNVFGALNGTKTNTVPDFVKNGGICWVLHQEREGWDASWLPECLRKNLRIDIKYLSKMISFRSNGVKSPAYVGPWLMERDHQIFHKPYFFDETDFAEWDIKTNGISLKTTAVNAITRHYGWEKIAGYEDVRTPLKDGALVMQARHGKGMYFWTQMLSPGLVWHMEGSREKETWSKFAKNIFQYFQDFKSGNAISVKTRISPWSVSSGDKAVITAEVPLEFKVSKIVLKAGLDDGNLLPEIKSDFVQKGSEVFLDYIPEKAGTHRINAVLYDDIGNSVFIDQFLKVTDGITRYRFTTHHHYCNDWATENLGQVYGSAQRWKQDAIFLASGLFYQPEDMFQIIDKDMLQKCDNPRTRIFPGQEIHPHHQYGLDEGNLDETMDSRHHIATMGCETIICDANYLEDDIIKRIHEKNGLAIVAHPNPTDPWWTEKMQTHICDGVCMDKGAFKLWDMMLNREKGVLYPCVRGSDSGPGEWQGGPANTAWLREPMTMQSLMKAAVNGRISFLYPKDRKFETASSYIWFDINQQLMGGTVYAVDNVLLNIKTESHILLKKICVVKDGNRTFKIIDVNDKKIELEIEENVLEDCSYYRIEAFAEGKKPGSKDLKPHMPEAWTNPIFVQKVNGPPGAWFYIDKDPGMIFNEKRGRFIPNATKIEKVEYSNGNWMIALDEPEYNGIIKIGKVPQKIKIDGEKTDFKRNEDKSCSVSFRPGKHTIEIKYKED